MKKLSYSVSPHSSAGGSTSNVMLCVILALLPAAVTGVINYGEQALILLGVTTATAMLSEALIRILLRKPQTVGDLSAAVTGMLLGMSLPPACPVLWAAAGSAFAVIIVKQLFGGIGKNFANPALTAKVLLLLLLRQEMYMWILPQAGTPMNANASLWDMFLGNTVGCIGETCTVGLLLGGVFLCLTGIIPLVTPAAFFGSFALLTWLGGYEILPQMMTGGLLLCAFFMATDYTTTPLTRRGKLLFGIGCGCVTYLIRHYGGYTEDACLAVLVMNLAVPLLDKLTAAKPFGAVPQPKKSRKDTAISV